MLRNNYQNIINITDSFLQKKINQLKYKNVSKLINPHITNKENFLSYNKSRHKGPDITNSHAPSRSNFFDMYGNALACCFNRTYVLGTYPKDNLNEIINGEKRNFLQNELSRQNFLYGCQHCLKQIESGNYYGTEARLYDVLPKNSKFPSEIIFELDNTCNLECIMCNGYFSNKLNNDAKDEAQKNCYDDNFINELKEFIPYLKIAKFLGGEPFLINIYYKIWDLILKINPNCQIHVQTNGTIYNPKIENYLRKGNFYIGISIDSLNKEVFAKIRKNADLDTVLKNTEKFIKLSKSRFTGINISVCPMQQNIREIPSLIDFCIERNIFIYFNHVYTEGFTLNELSEEDLLEIIKDFKTYKIKSNRIIAKRNKSSFKGLLKEIESIYNQKYLANINEKRRHKIDLGDIKLIFQEKVNFEENLLLKIDKVFDKNIKETILLSDNQQERLKKLDSKVISQIIENESLDNLQKSLYHFVETGDLNLDK